LLVSHALPSLRVALTGEVRRIVFCEKGAVVTTHPPRSRPITIMGSLPFEVHLHTEGAMDVQLKAHESFKPASMAVPDTPFKQGECSRTLLTCCWPNLDPHGTFQAPLSPRNRDMQDVGYGLRRAPLPRTRVNRTREQASMCQDRIDWRRG